MKSKQKHTVQLIGMLGVIALLPFHSQASAPVSIEPAPSTDSHVLQTRNTPVTIEAEAYSGSDGVKLENTTDIGGGENVGWIEEGDHMSYSIVAPTAGYYSLSLRIAATNSGGAIHISTDASSNDKSLSVTSTGDWQNWSTITTEVFLNSGNNTLRLDFSGSGYIVNVNWLSYVLVSSDTIIQAEDLSQSVGVKAEATSDVGGGDNIGWIQEGSYIAYDVFVPHAGNYDVQLRTASKNSDGVIHLSANSGEGKSSIPVENTGNWQVWTTQETSLPLREGRNTLELTFEGDSYITNLNWLNFSYRDSELGAGNGVGPVPSGLPNVTNRFWMETYYDVKRYVYLEEYDMHILGTEGVEDWTMLGAREMAKNMVDNLLDEKDREEFRNHHIFVITAQDPDVPYGIEGHKNTGTAYYTIFTQDLICATAVDTLRPDWAPEWRAWDTPVHEFGHSMESVLRLRTETIDFYEEHTAWAEGSSQGWEFFAWAMENWFDAGIKSSDMNFRGRLKAYQQIYYRDIFDIDDVWRPSCEGRP